MMKAAVKGHLDGLGKEIGTLIENSKPGSEAALASWSKNSVDIDVALKVLGAVSCIKTNPLDCLYSKQYYFAVAVGFSRSPNIKASTAVVRQLYCLRLMLLLSVDSLERSSQSGYMFVAYTCVHCC